MAPRLKRARPTVKVWFEAMVFFLAVAFLGGVGVRIAPGVTARNGV